MVHVLVRLQPSGVGADGDLRAGAPGGDALKHACVMGASDWGDIREGLSEEVAFPRKGRHQLCVVPGGWGRLRIM